VVLVGDFNSPAPKGDTFKFFTSHDYLDGWTEAATKKKGEGLTWGHAPDLRNATVQFTQRLDLVLFRQPGPEGPERHQPFAHVHVWGDELTDRTPSGLWPSDHAGVEAVLVIGR